MKRKHLAFALLLSTTAVCTAGVSKVDSRYFANEDGKTFVPVGCNICFPRMQDEGSVLIDTVELIQ